MSESSMNRTSTNRFPWPYGAGVAVVCLGLTVVSYAVGVGPLLQRRADARALRESLDGRSAEARQLAASVADLRRELADARTELNRMPLRLKPAALINQRLEAVARLATESGLALDEMQPGAAADAAHYQTVPIRILGVGDYPACVRFLRRLRETFADMGVRTFTAANRGGATAAPNAVFQAELAWFTELPRK
jgi:Tfp pilus assembly protein PilO